MTYTIAHRGMSSTHPENTLAAVEAALPHAHTVEFDVRATSEGALVCVHDHVLTRCHGDNRRVNAVTVEELRQVAADIPTLEAVLERYGRRVAWMIDFKVCGRAAEDALERCVRKSDLFYRTGRELREGQQLSAGALAVESGSARCLRRLAHRLPGVGCLFLVARGARPTWVALRAASVRTVAHGVVIPDSAARRWLVRWLHRLGLGVYVYTVNDTARLRELRSWGVHAAFTDAPDSVR